MFIVFDSNDEPVAGFDDERESALFLEGFNCAGGKGRVDVGDLPWVVVADFNTGSGDAIALWSPTPRPTESDFDPLENWVSELDCACLFDTEIEALRAIVRDEVWGNDVALKDGVLTSLRAARIDSLHPSRNP